MKVQQSEENYVKKMASGFLFMVSLIKVILLGSALLVCLLATAVPFWYSFSIKVSYDAGQTVSDKTLDLGLYYMDEGAGIDMIDLVFLGKTANTKPVPGMMRVAQIFFMIGTITLAVCFVTATIYLCRKYRTSTGELCLAGVIMPAAICLILGILFAALWPTADPGKWVGLPVPGHFVQLDPEPVVTINWGLYVGAVGTLIAIAASIVGWFQAIVLCKHVENVRYRMLRAPITEVDEYGKPFKGGPVYQPSRLPPYNYGYNKPGMEMDF